MKRMFIVALLALSIVAPSVAPIVAPSLAPIASVYADDDSPE